MHPRHASMFLCLDCLEGRLRPEALENDGERIRHGRLICEKCGRAYPIFDHVPVLFPPADAFQLMSQPERDFCQKHGIPLAGSSTVADKLADKKDMGEKWGFQWKEVYDDLEAGRLKGHWADDDYHQAHPWFVVTAEEHRGKSSLRLGAANGVVCAPEMADAADLMVHLDISDGIHLTESHGRRYENNVFVKADITALPFPPESFDIIMSGGVLHHLPNMWGGIAAAHQMAKPGGSLRLAIYNYSPFMIYLIEPLKRRVLFPLGDRAVWHASKLMTAMIFPFVKVVHALRHWRLVRLIPAHEHWISWGAGSHRFIFWAVYDLLHARLACYTRSTDAASFLKCLKPRRLWVEVHRQANIFIRADK